MRSETGEIPNKYTIYMGQMIRKAREEKGMSQEELAQKIYRKRLAVSEMENGKVEINAWILGYLAIALDKPLSYFFPPNFKYRFGKDDLSPLEQELLIHYRRIWNDDIKKLAISQVKSISEFDPEQSILESLELIEYNLENQVRVQEIIKSRPKYEKIFESILNLLSKINVN